MVVTKFNRVKSRLNCIWLIIVLSSCQDTAQAQIEGYYQGEINGGKISLTLDNDGHGNLKGKMQDEHQIYNIEALVTDNCLKGNATENNLQINLIVSGCLKNNQIEMSFDFSNVGLAEIQKVVFTKQSSVKDVDNENQPSIHNDTNRDAEVVGLWKQEQLYNSGYGDNYFGGSFTQKVVFYADGSIADGGSQATMSGNDYSGNSTSTNSGKIAGVTWSTKNRHLYITVTQNGQTQTVDVGKYYVENGKMLITDKNDNKTLLVKTY
ncbi:MAG TPA: hypothetical protein VKZ97_10585 [Flavobacteriaceae bacterium]|nr:hypothetical protein [Flavobacteriaceae bacterium]